MASLGYLMFGAKISDQVTKSIIIEEGFPSWIKIIIVIFMGILPVSKGPLILRPLITIVDQVTLNKSTISPKGDYNTIIKFVNRVLVICVFLTTALIFTDFGKIMSFLGSAICVAVCLVFPLSFYLKLFYDELSALKKALYFTGIFFAVVLAIVGTAAVIIA
jgi:vesicular inhibitory amino acid transporter